MALTLTREVRQLTIEYQLAPVQVAANILVTVRDGTTVLSQSSETVTIQDADAVARAGGNWGEAEILALLAEHYGAPVTLYVPEGT